MNMGELRLWGVSPGASAPLWHIAGCGAGRIEVWAG